MKARQVLFWVVFYSIAMGFLESAVVIYLRTVLYPTGFTFPLRPLHHELAAVELWREAATVIMLVSIGILAGKNKAERFAYFVLSFAIWDIFYYVFLYVFLAWPQSLLTWDILFLIPVPWVGPVLCPVIVSLGMIFFAVTVIHFSGKGINASLIAKERLLIISGSVIAIISFIEDYVRQNGSLIYYNLNKGGSFLSEMTNYVPQKFDWPVFLIGESVLLMAYVLYVRRIRKSRGN